MTSDMPAPVKADTQAAGHVSRVFSELDHLSGKTHLGATPPQGSPHDRTRQKESWSRLLALTLD